MLPPEFIRPSRQRTSASTEKRNLISILWRSNGRTHRSLTHGKTGARCAAPRPFSGVPSASPSTNRRLSVPSGRPYFSFHRFCVIGLFIVYDGREKMSRAGEKIFHRLSFWYNTGAASLWKKELQKNLESGMIIKPKCRKLEVCL